MKLLKCFLMKGTAQKKKPFSILFFVCLFVFLYLLCSFLFTTGYLHEQQGAFIEDYQTAMEFVPVFHYDEFLNLA